MMVAFNPDLCLTERDVESKLIVHYLLPRLGYAPDAWYEEVALGSIRLDFLVLASRLLATKMAEPIVVVMEAKRPKENLNRHVRQLHTYLETLRIRYGLLTNAIEVRVYELQGNTSAEIFRCDGRELHEHINRLKELIGKPPSETQILPKEDSSLDKISNTHLRSTHFMVGSSENNVVSPLRSIGSMKVIAVYHNKGGVGKTTTVTNLGAALARKGFRVLLVDLDSQANTTFAAGLMRFVFEEDDDLASKNIYHVIAEKNQFFISDVAREGSFCSVSINVVPAHINLTTQEKQLSDKSFAKTRLLDKLKKATEDYDFVLVDCPPSVNLYAQIALTSADYLLIPSDLKPFANEGLKNVRIFVDEIDEFRSVIQKKPLHILGVLPSKILTNAAFIKSTLPNLEAKIRDKYRFPVLESRIFERIDLARCINNEVTVGDFQIPDPKSIFDFKPNSESATEFEMLAAEVLAKIESTENAP